MKVAKVIIEAPATSFRYPHFLIGRQVSYEMPPPSTIYGHVASALAELPEPGWFRFAYHFEFASRVSDLEHQQIITRGTSGRGNRMVEVTEVTIQPHHRDFLFRPRLTLYFDRPELARVFREPLFCVALGRSQDLAQVVTAEETELVFADGAYFERTLLPFSFRTKTGFGTTVLMPRYIGPPPERDAQFERYIILHERIFGGNLASDPGPARRLMLSSHEPRRWLVDPATASSHGVQRGIEFLSFLAPDHESI